MEPKHWQRSKKIKQENLEGKKGHNVYLTRSNSTSSVAVCTAPSHQHRTWNREVRIHGRRLKKGKEGAYLLSPEVTLHKSPLQSPCHTGREPSGGEAITGAHVRLINYGSLPSGHRIAQTAPLRRVAQSHSKVKQEPSLKTRSCFVGRNPLARLARC